MKNKHFLIAKLLTSLAFGICIMPEANDSVKKTKMKDVQLHPGFPVVQDTYQMTKEWSVTLPGRFNRRIEDGSLVLWRPGFTIWTSVWGNDKKESAEKRLKEFYGKCFER